jgi:hypothetical protein
MITGSGTGFFKGKAQPVPAPADTKTEHRKKLSKWQQKLMQKPFS